MLKKKPLRLATVKLQGMAAFGGNLTKDVEIKPSKHAKNNYAAICGGNPVALLPEGLTPFLSVIEQRGYNCYGLLDDNNPNELMLDIFVEDLQV